MIIVLEFLLDDTWLLVPLHLALCMDIFVIYNLQFTLVSTFNNGLQRNIEVTCQVHKAHGKFWTHLLVHLFLVELIQILDKMFLELIQTLLNLLLFLLHDGWVLKVFHLHLGDGSEHLHVLS